MGSVSRKRKFFILVGLAVSIFLILLVVSPFWFPWIFPSILKNFGISYSQYERDGYNRFILRDVIFNRGTTRFEAKQVEALFPTTFLWRNFTDDHRENYLRMADWTLELTEAVEKRPSTNSVLFASKKLDAVLANVNRWVPKAILAKGAIRFKSKEIAIPIAEWTDGNLTGRISSEKLFPQTFFNARLGGKFPKGILVENPTWNIGGELVIVRQENNSLQIEGGILWQSNRLELAAQFGREGWLPEIASVKSRSFRIPAEILKLQGYRDLDGSLDVLWQTNRFAMDLTANAQPIESGEIFLSPVETVIHASGDTNAILLETATISSPWLQAKLSKNVEFSFRGELLSETAALSLAADLSKQHWLAANGLLNGEAILRRGTNRFPDATFALIGAEVEVGEIQSEQFNLQGAFDWPWLQISSASVRLKDGATAQANLKFNAVTRRIADGKLKLDGQIGQRFLPPEISYQNISLAADFSGPLKNITHSAHVELRDVKFPSFAPLGIVADWRGTQFDFESLQAKISAKDSSLDFSGAGSFRTNQITARVEKLVLAKNGESVLALEKSFAVSSAKIGTNWSATIEPLRWRGKGTEISLAAKVQWPLQGGVSVSATQFNFSPFQDFIERPLPNVLIERFNTAANWTNGPVNFSFDTFARFTSKDGTPFSAELRSSGNAKGTTIESANVGTKTESVISGKGFLPITILPGSSNLLQTIPKGSIDFRAETIPNTQFWEELATWTQTSFHEPRVSIGVSGTVDAPQGKIVASVKEVVLKPKDPDQPIPRFQNLLADFDLVRERVRLNRFEVFVEGQPVTATGELPLPKVFERDWRKVFDWRKADAHLKIVDAQIAPFERLFPKFLSPLGTMNLDVAIAPGGKLDGELRIENAALRPIPTLGPVHDIKARLKLAGDQVKLETFEGFLGGEAVNLSGEINLASYASTNLPAFNFKLRGTNVPLARSPDFILRSDLDLGISNKKGGVPSISGTLNLRDSFYLSDLKRLVPGKIVKPKNRPPYFSVDTEPFANWRLNVTVQGANALKVRSPLFRGELSANLKLDGTLQEPFAMGHARINSGVVQFPFANLRVDQGFISLTSENPHRPQLSFSASARTFGYDVKMEVSGPADKPNIEFSSNPGLTSEQILLMVTAGELPRDEVTFSTQQKAGRLAFFLGKNLMSKFGSNDARDDKLEIRSGENISEQGRQTYYLEYKLTDDWSIVGEYDRFGGLNAGFKWKFFQK